MTARRLALLLLLSSLAVTAAVHTQSRKVRIACIGTDITFGSGIGSRDVNSYPSQLQALLGEGFEVRNYGKNGATVLKKGENPYTQEPEYREALEFHPDIVFIELGTNDSQPHDRVYLSGFERDYTDIVQSFLGLPSGCRVVLLLPPPRVYCRQHGDNRICSAGSDFPSDPGSCLLLRMRSDWSFQHVS